MNLIICKVLSRDCMKSCFTATMNGSYVKLFFQYNNVHYDYQDFL